MLYKEELKNYLMHFPNIYYWKVSNEQNLKYLDKGKISKHSGKVLYFQIEPLIDSLSENSKELYEFHTDIGIIQYLEGNDVRSGFGIAIDIDTKGRENEIKIENLQQGKDTATYLMKIFAGMDIKTMLKFSGGGYHILMFFDSNILDASMTKKDMLNIVKAVIKNANIGKEKVKEIEIKGDKIRALYSYNSKYNNYSILTDEKIKAEDDFKNSKTYQKQTLDFNELINKKIESSEFNAYFEKIKKRKENTKKFIEKFNEIKNLFEKNDINAKEIELNKDETGMKDFKKEKELISKIINETNIDSKDALKYLLYYIKSEKNMNFYDKIYQYGAKDGRKRLLFLVIGPYVALKFGTENKEKIKKELQDWLIRSGVSKNNLYDYEAEIKSLSENMEEGIKPTSIDSLLLRFGMSNKEDFASVFMNKEIKGEN